MNKNPCHSGWTGSSESLLVTQVWLFCCALAQITNLMSAPPGATGTTRLRSRFCETLLRGGSGGSILGDDPPFLRSEVLLNLLWLDPSLESKLAVERRIWSPVLDVLCITALERGGRGGGLGGGGTGGGGVAVGPSSDLMLALNNQIAVDL